MGAQCSEILNCGKASNLQDQREIVSRQSTPASEFQRKRFIATKKDRILLLEQDTTDSSEINTFTPRNDAPIIQQQKLIEQTTRHSYKIEETLEEKPVEHFEEKQDAVRKRQPTIQVEQVGDNQDDSGQLIKNDSFKSKEAEKRQRELKVKLQKKQRKQEKEEKERVLEQEKLEKQIAYDEANLTESF